MRKHRHCCAPRAAGGSLRGRQTWEHGHEDGRAGVGTVGAGSQGGAGRGPRRGSEVGPRAAPHPLLHLLLLLRRPRRRRRHYLPQPLKALVRLSRRASRLPNRARPTTDIAASDWTTPPPLFSCCRTRSSPIGQASPCLSLPAPRRCPHKTRPRPRCPPAPSTAAIGSCRCHGDVFPPTTRSRRPHWPKEL